MAAQRLAQYKPVRSDVPDFHRSVTTGRRQGLAVMAEGNAVHAAGVAGNIPDPHLAVASPCQEMLPFGGAGAKGDTLDPLAVPNQREEVFPGFGVPDPRRIVGADTGEAGPGSINGNVANTIYVTCEHSNRPEY